METRIRFGDFVSEASVHQREVSYNDLAALAPEQAARIHIQATEAAELLKPYVTPRFMEQAKAVVPLALYLVLFQLLMLRQGVARSWAVSAGLAAVMIGLMLFMEGLKLGLMPLGETLGNTLPARRPLPVVLFVTFLLGIGVTLAEPAIGALQEAGKIVSPQGAPILYTLLTAKATLLKTAVAIGVGLAAVLGTLRFVYNWSLKPLIYFSVLPALALTLYAHFDPNMRQVIGVAWDCGAVTTGPVTVPLVIALGIGVAAAVGKGESKLQGFGIVTLASVFPIITVLLSSLLVDAPVAPPAAVAAGAVGWYSRSPTVEILAAIQAIVPLVLYLLLVMKFVARKAVPNLRYVIYGVVLAVVGMAIFNLGLTYGLASLGGQSGSLIPAAFMTLDQVAGSPLYFFALGIAIAALFSWFLGFGATLAEPALNALGITVENLTNGAFKKSMLMYAVSIGVATGISLGVLKVIFGWNLLYFLIPGYLLLLVVTYFSSEEFVNVGWDSAGVTTGPVTVPLVLAMGLGLGNAVKALDGFGILSLASLCPILSVLLLGLWVQWRNRKLTEAGA
ncbi:MAG TPA: DUF1538 domain-containing protein [Vicinamibacteria bacterium]|nr:DUF1538 domain-containing protein [Vicinamibacteria bacterium]